MRSDHDVDGRSTGWVHILRRVRNRKRCCGWLDRPDKESALDVATNHRPAWEEGPDIPKPIEVGTVGARVGVEVRDLWRIGRIHREIKHPESGSIVRFVQEIALDEEVVSNRSVSVVKSVDKDWIPKV